jgi:hypothetical protein
MSDIFQEVDEDVRRDKAVEFWSKYQNHLFVLAALIVLATAGYRFYDYRRAQAAEAAGAAFQDVLKLDHDGKTAEAEAALAKLQTDAPPGYQALTRFIAAGLKAKTDPKAAAAAFDAIAADKTIDDQMRGAAGLRAALARLDSGDVEAAKIGLTTLALPANPYRHTARLTLGAIALGEKQYDVAGKWLDTTVADPDAPQAERRDAETLLGVVAANAPARK